MVEAPRVLVVEPDAGLRDSLDRHLDSLGYQRVMLESGDAATPLLERSDSPFDVILLGLDTDRPAEIELLRSIRGLCEDAALLVLSESDDASTRVASLEQGADDCMSKPVVMEEVSARIQAVCRRSMRLPVLRFESLRMDLGRRVVEHRRGRLHLSPKEFDVLRILMQAQGVVVDRRTLLSEAWGSDTPPETNIVEMLMTRLRRKLSRFGDTQIVTEVGRGYRLEGSPDPGD